MDSAGDDAAPLGAFSTPQPLSTLSAGAEDDPTLTADMLEIVFESSRAGGCGGADLWWSFRSTTASPWTAPIALAALCSAQDDEHPGFSGDGLTIYFSSRRPGGSGDHDIWMATRTARASTIWTTPVRLLPVETATSDEGAQPTADHLTLVYASGPDSVNENVMIATRAADTDPWSAPMLVDAVDVNGSTTDSSPALTSNKRTLYFSSNRSGVHRIYRASRANDNAAFGASELVPELMVTGGEADPWISPDERTIVYAASGGQLYEATR